MTPDIRFLVFDHIRHVRQIRDHVRQFYSNCRTLFCGEKLPGVTVTFELFLEGEPIQIQY